MPADVPRPLPRSSDDEHAPHDAGAGTDRPVDTTEAPAKPPTQVGTRLSVLSKALLAAGALAGALSTIVALLVTMHSWLPHDPKGTVKRLRLQNVRPLTYGEWRDHERVPLTGVPKSQLRIQGKLITFDVETQGYKQHVVLPVRIIVHDVTHQRSRTIEADAIEVTAGDDCGCFEWVAVPNEGTRYYLEVAVFPPGAIRGQPLRTAATDYFTTQTSGASVRR
jgi:hypothetical protein